MRQARTFHVAVLMGGPSAEHDISLKSGRGVTEALSRLGWQATPVAIPRDLSVPDALAWTARALRRATCDVVFLALHGEFGEDGAVQQLCEDLELGYTGSDAGASRLGLDKAASRREFEQVGLQVPRWELVERGRKPAAALAASLGERLQADGFVYPLVIKPLRQGSSLGISIIRDPQELPAALNTAGRFDAQVIIEQFIAGRELTVGVIGDAPLPIVEIRPRHPFFDYEAKYTTGLTDYVVPAPLPPDVAQSVRAAGHLAHQALGCRHVSRTDLLLDQRGTPVILEVNTLPGFTPTSLLPKAAASHGVSYEALCERLVLMAGADLTPRRRSPRPRRAPAAHRGRHSLEKSLRDFPRTKSRKCKAFLGAAPTPMVGAPPAVRR